jgi:hypothetical protein
MTIAAIYAFVADVVLVAELYGLLAGEECLRVIRRPVDAVPDQEDCPYDEYSAEDGRLRYEIRAAMEDLRHWSPHPEQVPGKQVELMAALIAAFSPLFYFRGNKSAVPEHLCQR